MFGKRLSKSDMPKMFIGESEVMWSNDCLYIGIMFCNGEFFSCSIDDRRRKFCATNFFAYSYAIKLESATAIYSN